MAASAAPLTPVASSAATPGISAPLTINMQASGDPAANRAAADMAGKAAAQHMEIVAMSVLQRESWPGGSLHQSGVRRRA